MKSRVPRPTVGQCIGLAVLAAAILGDPAAGQQPQAQDHWTLIERLTDDAAREVIGELGYAPGTVVHLVPETDHSGNWMAERALARILREQGCSVVLSRYAAPPSTAPPAVEPAAPLPSSAAGSGEAPGTATPPESASATEEELPEAREEDAGGAAGEGEEAEEGEEGAAQAEGTEEEPPSLAAQRQRARAESQEQAATAPAAAPPAEFDLVLPASGEALVYRVVELDVSYPWVKRAWVVGPSRYGRLASVRLRATRMLEPGHSVAGVGEGDRVAMDEFPGWARPYLEGQGYPFAIRQAESRPVQRFLEPLFVGAIVSGLVYLFYENQK